MIAVPRRARRLHPVIGVLAAVALQLAIGAGGAGAQTSSEAPRSPLPEGYAGADACRECHKRAFSTLEATKMGRLFLKHPRTAQERLGCETCHGPGKVHAESNGEKPGDLISFAGNDRTAVEKRNRVCLACHERGAHILWKGSAHDSREIGCTACHTVMTSVSPSSQLRKSTEIETCGTCHRERRAQQMRSSHMPLREGKMTCSSCHSPHGTVARALLKELSVNDTCYVCHAEKRGPFLWEHAPVTESCVTCHDPHGSNRERLLKVSMPRLCQQCHVERSHPSMPHGRGSDPKFVMGRSCASCHVNIHGSNHPSGFRFTR